MEAARDDVDRAAAASMAAVVGPSLAGRGRPELELAATAAGHAVNLDVHMTTEVSSAALCAGCSRSAADDLSPLLWSGSQVWNGRDGAHHGSSLPFATQPTLPSPQKCIPQITNAQQPKKRGRPRGAKRLAKDAEAERKRLAQGGHARPATSDLQPATGTPSASDLSAELGQAVSNTLARPSAASSSVVGAIGSSHRPPYAVPVPGREEGEDHRLRQAGQSFQRRKSTVTADSSASDSDVPATDEEDAASRRNGLSTNARRPSDGTSSRPAKRQRPSYVALFPPVVDDRQTASPRATAPEPVMDARDSSDEVDELDLIDEPVRAIMTVDLPGLDPLTFPPFALSRNTRHPSSMSPGPARPDQASCRDDQRLLVRVSSPSSPSSWRDRPRLSSSRDRHPGSLHLHLSLARVQRRQSRLEQPARDQ